MSQNIKGYATDELDHDESPQVSFITIKFPCVVKQTDERKVEMRVPYRRGIALLAHGAIDTLAPDLSTEDKDLLTEMIETYAFKQALRMSIRIS